MLEGHLLVHGDHSLIKTSIKKQSKVARLSRDGFLGVSRPSLLIECTDSMINKQQQNNHYHHSTLYLVSLEPRELLLEPYVLFHLALAYAREPQLSGFKTTFTCRVCGALVQFGCYQHRYEWKDLWCSSTVRLLSA